jgi:hypothetical protein
MIAWIAYAVAAALAVGGAWWAKSSYDEDKREEGRAELRPSLSAATEQLNENARAFDEINGYMSALKTKTASVKQAVALAQKANLERQRQESERLAEIDSVPVVGNTACERTSNTIRSVLR